MKLPYCLPSSVWGSWALTISFFLVQQLILLPPSVSSLKAEHLGELFLTDEAFMSASYNQGDDAIYIFGGRSSNRIYRFDLETPAINQVGGTLAAQGTAVGTGGENVYVFGGHAGSHRTQIYRWNSSREEPNDLTELVANLPAGCIETSAVWDEEGGAVYVFGGEFDEVGPRLDSVLKFNLGTHTIAQVASLPVGRSRTSAVWDQSTSHAYIFGGEEAGKERSDEILKFNPATNTITRLNVKFPDGIEFSCAVWTGREAYIIVSNHAKKSNLTGQPLETGNIFRFTPDGSCDGGKIVAIPVEDFYANIYGTACAYVESTDRIYVFGGVANVYYRDVFFIQLDSRSTSSTTEGPTSTSEGSICATESPAPTSEGPTSPSTTADPTSTTEELTSTTEDPTSTSVDHTSTTEVPTSATEDPTSTTEEPATSTTVEPTSTTDEITSTFTTEKPSSTTEDPTSTSEGEFSTTEPSTTAENPTSTTEVPSSTTDIPTSTTEHPTSATEDPTSTTDFPTTTEDPTDPTSSTSEEPTTTPSISEKPTTEPVPPSPMPTTTGAGTTTELLLPPTTTVDPLNPAVCNETDNYGIQFQTTAGNRAIAPCPSSYNGTASWYCRSTGLFAGPQPDYTDCTNGWLPDIRDQLPEDGEPAIDGTTARGLVADLAQNVERATNYENNVTYFGHEIAAIFEVGAAILQATNATTTSVTVREQLTATIFGVFSTVLTFQSPWEQLDPVEGADGRAEDPPPSRARAATAFVVSTEATALTLARQPRNYGKEFPAQQEFNVLAGAQRVYASASESHALLFPLASRLDREKDSYIEVPSSWVSNFQPGAFAPFSGLRIEPEYGNLLFKPPQRGLDENDEVEGDGGGTVLNGPLMGFTFAEEDGGRRTRAHPRMNFTDGGVRITFRHDVVAWGEERKKLRRKLHRSQGERPKAASRTATCAYWDPSTLQWSTSGCVVISSAQEVTVCECSHLTSFALIMDLHQYIGADLALEILTLILTPLSTLGLLAYILFFVYHRKKQRLMSSHPRNELTLGLCVALLVSNLLIMVTLDRNYLYLSDGACMAAGIGLHYALTCAFAWMGLEGVLLARLILVDVFSSGREHVRLERGAAFVVPAVIVGATCAVSFTQDSNGNGKDNEGAYGNDSYCWLNGSYLWAFLGPVAIVVVFNGIVLSLAVRKSHVLQAQHMHARASNTSSSTTKRQADRARRVALWLQGALNLTALMGITWAAGFLMLADNSTVAHLAAYAFTLFNASQGLFIFAFHVAANKRIRRKLSLFPTKSTSADVRGHGNGHAFGNSRSEMNTSTQMSKAPKSS